MYGALNTKYRANSTFLFNSTTLAVIMKMVSATSGAFIWQQSLADGPQTTVIGRPYVICETLDSEGSGKYPVFLGDFQRGYFVVNRTPIEVVRDPFTAKPSVEFLFIARNGGAVVTAEAIKKLSI
jgi:HK97 family phage major capsid protein